MKETKYFKNSINKPWKKRVIYWAIMRTYRKSISERTGHCYYVMSFGKFSQCWIDRSLARSLKQTARIFFGYVITFEMMRMIFLLFCSAREFLFLDTSPNISFFFLLLFQKINYLERRKYLKSKKQTQNFQKIYEKNIFRGKPNEHVIVFCQLLKTYCRSYTKLPK